MPKIVTVDKAFTAEETDMILRGLTALAESIRDQVSHASVNTNISLEEMGDMVTEGLKVKTLRSDIMKLRDEAIKGEEADENYKRVRNSRAPQQKDRD